MVTNQIPWTPSEPNQKNPPNLQIQIGIVQKKWDVFWESNPTNIKSPSGKCSASNGNASAELGKGRSISSEDFTGRGEGLAEGGGRVAGGGNELAAGGAVVAAARWDSTPLPLFASRKATGDELAHLRDFRFGEQLEGGDFIGGNDRLSSVPVEVREVGVGGILGVG